MGTEARLAVAEHSRALRPQPIARSYDVVDLVADVMHTARRIALEKGLHRRGCAERFEQLDLGVWQLDKDDRHPMRRQRARLRDASAQYLAVGRARLRDIGHDDRDMVEPADHREMPPAPPRLAPTLPARARGGGVGEGAGSVRRGACAKRKRLKSAHAEC